MREREREIASNAIKGHTLESHSATSTDVRVKLVEERGGSSLVVHFQLSESRLAVINGEMRR